MISTLDELHTCAVDETSVLTKGTVACSAFVVHEEVPGNRADELN